MLFPDARRGSRAALILVNRPRRRVRPGRSPAAAASPRSPRSAAIGGDEAGRLAGPAPPAEQRRRAAGDALDPVRRLAARRDAVFRAGAAIGAEQPEPDVVDMKLPAAVGPDDVQPDLHHRIAGDVGEDLRERADVVDETLALRAFRRPGALAGGAEHVAGASMGHGGAETGEPFGRQRVNPGGEGLVHRAVPEHRRDAGIADAEHGVRLRDGASDGGGQAGGRVHGRLTPPPPGPRPGTDRGARPMLRARTPARQHRRRGNPPASR